MNGRSGLMTISPRSRQARPRTAERGLGVGGWGWGVGVGPLTPDSCPLSPVPCLHRLLPPPPTRQPLVPRLRQHLRHPRVARRLALARVQQLAQRHLRLAAQDEVQGGEGAQRLQGERRDVRAEGDGRRAQGLGQEDAVQVVAQGGRGDVREIVFGSFLFQQLLELGPAHAQGVAVDDLQRVVGQQDGGQLRQAHLRPDHVLAAAPAHTVLAADPDPPIRGRRVHEQDVDAARGPGRGERLHGRAGVREARRGEGREAMCAKIGKVSSFQF